MGKVAIRFFRQLVTLQEEFYIKHIAEKHILGPVLDVLIATLPRDNLLSSACLDLFGHINKENIKDLVKHLVENYREKLVSLSYLDTFREILNRYDTTQGYTANVDPYFLESEDEVGRRPAHPGSRGMMEHLAVDPAQEEYWNTSDDEDDMHGKPLEHPASANGATPKPLVEYTSDEEVEDSGDAAATAPAAATTPQSEKGEKADIAKGSDPSISPARGPASSPTSETSPPERLSEKRRREEDEEDELGKLMLHKRRNSSSASLNAAGNATTALRNKKKGTGGSRDPSPMGGKKIAISITSGVKSSVGAKGTSGKDDD